MAQHSDHFWPKDQLIRAENFAAFQRAVDVRMGQLIEVVQLAIQKQEGTREDLEPAIGELRGEDAHCLNVAETAPDRHFSAPDRLLRDGFIPESAPVDDSSEGDATDQMAAYRVQ